MFEKMNAKALGVKGQSLYWETSRSEARIREQPRGDRERPEAGKAWIREQTRGDHGGLRGTTGRQSADSGQT